MLFYGRTSKFLVLTQFIIAILCIHPAFAQTEGVAPPADKPAVVVPRADNFIQRFDDRTLVSLALHRSPEVTPPLQFFSRNIMYYNVGVPAGLLIGGIVTNDRTMRENAGYVAASTAVTVAATYLLKKLIQRPRPFVRNLKIIPVYIAGESSFPSGHSSSSFATSMALSQAYPKWYVIAPSFIWAGATAYSRMYLGVHYPTDVLGGAVLGSGTAILLKGPMVK